MATQYPGSCKNVALVPGVDEDMIDDQVVPLAKPGESRPLPALVPRLVDPSVDGPKIKVGMIMRVYSEPSCVTPEWTKRQPAHSRCAHPAGRD